MSKERGDKPSQQGVEGGASAIQCKPRFEGGRATLSDIAELLAEVSCGMSEEEAKRKDQALPEAYRTEAAYLNGMLSSWSHGPSQMLPNQLKFDTTFKSFTRYLIQKAESEVWSIEEEGGAPQFPPRRHGYLFVEKVSDHYTKTVGSQHTRFVEALRVALTAPVKVSQPKNRHKRPGQAKPGPSAGYQIPALPTPDIAEAFSFYRGLKKALGDSKNHHHWLLPARVSEGSPPFPHTWCPLEVAKALLSRGASEGELNKAFLSAAVLKPWLLEWQDARRQRNGFGQ
jgi:hypothetical protein